MNPVEVRTVKETWLAFPSRNSDALWTVTSDAWDEVVLSQFYVRSLVEFMPRRMQPVFEVQGLWTSYY